MSLVASRWLGVVLGCTLPLVPRSSAGAESGPRTVAACEALLARDPSSPEGYRCLVGQPPGERLRIHRIVERQLRIHPSEPWAVLYEALFRAFSGERVPESRFALAVEGFRQRADRPGLVQALLSEVGERCFAESRCDDAGLGMMEESERLAEGTGDVYLRRISQLFWLRWAIRNDDLSQADRAVERIDATPGTDPPWMARQLRAQRAFLAGQVRALEERRALYSEQAASTAPGTADHAQALGGLASADTALALRGRFDPEEVERVSRDAIAAEDAAGLQVALIDPMTGAIATRVHLALLLGRGPESSRLLDEALKALRSQTGWSYPWYARWLQVLRLAEGPPPQPGPALAAAEAAVAQAAEWNAGWERARSVLMRAHVLWRSGERTRARVDGLAAISALEGLRRRQWDARTRMRYEDTLAFAYELVAGSLLDVPAGAPSPADVDDALGVMERLRARTLLESLVRRGPPGVAEGAAEIGVAHRALLQPGVPAEERVQWVERLRTAERSLGAAIAAGAADDALAPPSVPALQAALRPDEALVSFQQWSSEPGVDAPYTDGSSWGLVLTPTARHVVRIAGARELEPVALLWLSLLERRDGSEAAGSERLAAAVLRPVLQALPPEVRSLIIVPDGVVHRLPLDALPISTGGPLLGERYQVAVAPSAAVWLRLRSAPPRAPGLPLALSDPPLSASARRELERVSAGVPLEIPESRGEAESAVAAFPRGGRLLTGAEARREALTGPGAKQFALIHVATHALLDIARPERSALVLAPGTADDGLLPLDEISRLQLDRAVVVLSACHSSGGALRRGEGTLSLGRAFFEAGARTVVGSLTSVRDDESAALFREFYRRVASGAPVGVALSEAKRARIRAGAPPAAWASYVLLGDSLAAPRTAPAPRSWMWIAGGAAAAVLLALIARGARQPMRSGWAVRRRGGGARRGAPTR